MPRTSHLISNRKSLLSWVAPIAFGACFALGMAFDGSAQAQTDLSIYSDAPLGGGWNNWSWATTDVTSTVAVHAGSTSIAVAAGPYQALYLHHDPFDTTGYGTLTFWINGGAAGQPKLQVAASLFNINDPANDLHPPAVPIGPIGPNSWQEISIPLVSLGADKVPTFSGFWIQESGGTDQTLNPFYLDDIVLTAGAAPPPPPTNPPPPLNGGMALYDDYLTDHIFTNDWQDWSFFATITNFRNGTNPAFVNSGTNALAVAPSQAGAALRFHHAMLDTHDYASLTFWINGGDAGGQVLSVNALIAGAAQPGFLVGPLVANTWQKLVIPLADLGVANVPNLSDIWIQDVSGGAGPTFYVDDVRLDLGPPPRLVNVTVHAKSPIRRVDPRTFGLNTATWDGTLATPTTTSLLNEINIQALRFPGGSTSNGYHWKTNMSEGNTFQWATSFDAFAGIATAVHAQVYVTVNYGTGTPEEAADWVRHSNLEKGYGFKYWEVGNENYGNWEMDHNTRPQDPVIYATRFAEYARQMKAVDPSIKIGAVLLADEDSFANYPADEVVVNPRTAASHSGWSAVMLSTFKQLGVTPDFVVYHRYEQGPFRESDVYLLGASRGWGGDAANIRQMLNDYLGGKAKRVDIDSTETNSVYAQPGKQTTSLVGGLFLADSLGNIMKTEFNSCFWWDLRNDRETNNVSPSLYGWRPYGDYGLVNYADPPGPADRYPTFYVQKLLTHYARGGETVVDATSDYNGLGIYAVRDHQTKTLNLLVINKHPVAALNTSVTIAGFRVGHSAEVFTYGIPQDDAARTGIGSADVAQSTATLAGRTFTLNPGPYSATVIKISHRRLARGDRDDDDDDSDND
jgi:hypothetical protein